MQSLLRRLPLRPYPSILEGLTSLCLAYLFRGGCLSLPTYKPSYLRRITLLLRPSLPRRLPSSPQHMIPKAIISFSSGMRPQAITSHGTPYWAQPRTRPRPVPRMKLTASLRQTPGKTASTIEPMSPSKRSHALPHGAATSRSTGVVCRQSSIRCQLSDARAYRGGPAP